MSTKNLKSSQKALGNAVEREFAQKMFDKGWWVHLFADKVNGQPCDIVMCRSKVCWFLDAKSVQGKEYLLHSRIEPNQINTFTLLKQRGMKTTGFVIKFDDGWWLLKFSDMNLNDNKTEKEKMTKLSI